MVSRRARAAVSSDICFIEVIGKRVFFLEELTTLIFVLALLCWQHLTCVRAWLVWKQDCIGLCSA